MVVIHEKWAAIQCQREILVGGSITIEANKMVRNAVISGIQGIGMSILTMEQYKRKRGTQ